MPHAQLDPLLEAVEALTRHRIIRTPLEDGEVHIERHPPLLQLLQDGTGITRKTPSSASIALPIDIKALEIADDITRHLREWTLFLGLPCTPGDLTREMSFWYMHHANAVRARKPTFMDDADTTRILESWAREILAKFEPDERREWTDPCPAVLATTIDGRPHRCGARRITVDGEEAFAIEVNVTRRRAICRACGTVWDGERGLMMLRYETNLLDQARHADTATTGTRDVAVS